LKHYGTNKKQPCEGWVDTDTSSRKTFARLFLRQGDIMKKITLIALTIFLLILTACGSASNGTTPVSDPRGAAPAGELPAATQLILGTLKLEETENAVTAEQAAQLLPLWQTLQVLSESDTAADQEIEALTTQIQETMTAEQMQAITDMNLTREDMMTAMQEQGFQTGAQQERQGNSSQDNGSGLPGAGVPGVPGGGPRPEEGVGGPGGFGGAQGLSREQIATAQASRQQRGGDFVSPMLINALIKYLEEKAAS
jgi:hypothetical protein